MPSPEEEYRYKLFMGNLAELGIDTRRIEDGAISQGSWLDFQPFIKGVYEGTREMLGLSSSERLMKHLRDIKSPVLRPQSAFEWADKGAGIAAEGLQTVLAAADLAGLAGAVGPAAGRRLAQTMADETGTFGGGMAKNPPKDTSEWFTGMEGKRKFEIDDSGLQIKNLKPTEATSYMGEAGGKYAFNEPLSDVLQHDELFGQYPELKDVRVFFEVDPHWSDRFERGAFHSDKNQILARGKDLDQAKDTLTHEIQHWIQQKEGFARGGSPGAPVPSEHRMKYIQDTFKKIRPADAQAGIPIKDTWATAKDFVDKDISGIGGRYSYYRDLAGEIEARDAANRRTWPMDLRRTMPPDLRKDAIIRMEGGGAQASISDDLASKNIPYRPLLTMGDIEGMYPGGGKKLLSKNGIDYYSTPDGLYALKNGKEVGFALPLSEDISQGFDVSVASEAQRKGIGSTLFELFKKQNPDYPTGGLTKAGKGMLEKVSRESGGKVQSLEQEVLEELKKYK